MLRHPSAQLCKDALAAVFRLLERIDRLAPARAAIRLPPCAFLVSYPARLHLDGEDSVVRMQHDEIRLALRSCANTIAQPAVRMEHRVVIAEHLKRTVNLPLTRAPMKVPRQCGIESCHRIPHLVASPA